jgi:hypothetical protein
MRVTGPRRRPKLPPRPEDEIMSERLNDLRCLDLLFAVTTAGRTTKFLEIVDEGSH